MEFGNGFTLGKAGPANAGASCGELKAPTRTLLPYLLINRGKITYYHHNLR